MNYPNVVVFGDSLSDIGIKWTSIIGRIGRQKGEMTVNPSGRFSDCRNWTDYMYEDASGYFMVHSDASTTITASKMHQRLNKDSKLLSGSEQEFRFANYAEGGACGGIPKSKIMRYIALTTLKSQVRRFSGDYRALSLQENEYFLFFVWFGANDLYTAGAPASAMGGVAEKVAVKRRNEIATIVGGAPRFVFVNLALPLSSVRYQRVFETAQRAKQATANSVRADKRTASSKALARRSPRSYVKTPEFRDMRAASKLYETRMLINNFESGALLYNSRLQEYAERNGDVYIDMASVVSKDSLSGLLEGMKLIPGTQPKGTSKTFRSGLDVDDDDGWDFVSTSDEAHPTSRVYKLMWDHIKSRLNEEGISFGKL